MSSAPHMARLPDGRRLHLQHGPIDLIVEAFGAPGELEAAYEQAKAAFEPVLNQLVECLPALRKPLQSAAAVTGPVAIRMAEAVRPHRDVFVTPMAAVAGSVADHILAAMVEGRDLTRAYVNNGGDIALHLACGTSFAAAVVNRPDAPAIDGIAEITDAMPVRGIATSGWRGRSLSLGIADAVTVFAPTAAAADVAATLIANTVTADDPAIRRTPATDIDADSDLGSRPVTVDVGPLAPETIRMALASGQATAAAMRAAGLIHASVLSLAGQTVLDGPPEFLPHKIKGQIAA